MITYQTPVIADWVDYNGHLRDAFYLLIFSYATDAFMDRIGLSNDDRGQNGTSLFTLEAHIHYLHEVKLDAHVEVHSQVIGYDRKRLRLYHSLHLAGDATVLAASEQMLLHVDLTGPKSAPFGPRTVQLLEKWVEAQEPTQAPPYPARAMSL